MANSSVSYRALLAKRGFAGLLLAVCVGRLSSGLLPFGLTALFVQGDQYLSAGIVSVCFMFATSATAPWRGRYIDRHSARLALPRFALISIACVTGGFAMLHLSHAKLIGAELVTVGAALTPLNSVVLRSIWSRIAPDEGERQALHALDSLLEEGIYVLTPLLVSALWALVGPDWAILLAGFSIGGGTFLLFRFAQYAGATVSIVLDETHDVPAVSADSKRRTRRLLVFTQPGLALAGPMFGFSLTMGVGAIAYAAWSSAHYTASLTGVFASLGSAGGLVGGLVYGKLRMSNPTASKLYLAMPAFVGLCTLPMLWTTSAAMACCVAFVAGMVMTPMFIAAFVRVPLTFDKAYFNEANASIGATYNVGSGLGSLLAGALVQRGLLHAAFGCSVLVPVVAASVAFLWSRRLGGRPAAMGAPESSH